MMEKMSAETATEEMTLMFLYLTGWKETYCYRSWKGYDFKVLDELTDKDLLCLVKNPSKSKSVVMSDEGLKRARELLEKYNIEDPRN